MFRSSLRQSLGPLCDRLFEALVVPFALLVARHPVGHVP